MSDFSSVFICICGGIWGNGTFPLPVAEEGKVPFPQPRLGRAVA